QSLKTPVKRAVVRHRARCRTTPSPTCPNTRCNFSAQETPDYSPVALSRITAPFLHDTNTRRTLGAEQHDIRLVQGETMARPPKYASDEDKPVSVTFRI